MISLRTEQHIGQFVLGKIITCSEEVPGRFFFAEGRKISTLKTIMIINVCIEIINASSMLDQCFFKESSMNHR